MHLKQRLVADLLFGDLLIFVAGKSEKSGCAFSRPCLGWWSHSLRRCFQRLPANQEAFGERWFYLRSLSSWPSWLESQQCPCLPAAWLVPASARRSITKSPASEFFM